MTGCSGKKPDCYERLSPQRVDRQKIRFSVHMGTSNWKIVVDGSRQKKTTTSGALMLEISRTYHKRDFLCAMSRFRMRFFIRLKLIVPSSFFPMLLLMAIKFHLKKRWVQPNNILKAKGSERDFLCRNPKGIFIIFALVFIVLMLIRCIASRPFHEKEYEEEAEEEDKSIRFV